MMHELKANNTTLKKEILEMNMLIEDVKKGWKIEKESWQRSQGEEQVAWADQRKSLSDKVNAMENDVKTLQMLGDSSALKDIKSENA